jgi:transcriptional regulator with XRE-family HTH domain
MAEVDVDWLYGEIGRKIRDVREQFEPKLSQEKLAKRLQMSRASVVNIEAGRQHAPVHLLWQIAEILGTDLALLIPRREDADLPANPVLLDKATIQGIRRAARGDPETQKALTSFVSKLKTTLETTEKRKTRS